MYMHSPYLDSFLVINNLNKLRNCILCTTGFSQIQIVGHASQIVGMQVQEVAKFYVLGRKRWAYLCHSSTSLSTLY
jgi:hypothetical protein